MFMNWLVFVLMWLADLVSWLVVWIGIYWWVCFLLLFIYWVAIWLLFCVWLVYLVFVICLDYVLLVFGKLLSFGYLLCFVVDYVWLLFCFSVGYWIVCCWVFVTLLFALFEFRNFVLRWILFNFVSVCLIAISSCLGSWWCLVVWACLLFVYV